MPSIQRAKLVALARTMDAARAIQVAAQVSAWRSVDAAALATLLGAAFPPFATTAARDPVAFESLAREGWRAPRDRAEYLRRFAKEVGDPEDEDSVRPGLRRVVRRELLRIALRELLPPKLGGADVDITAQETADLAEASVEVALSEAIAEAERKFGAPKRDDGSRSEMVVIGMGKLGGRELNVGSDIDVLYIYDTDEGATESGDTLHEFWARVARRMTSTLEEQTEDGAAWRVDLRLRPEGSRGAIVNSTSAALRYYEGWGRPWERAALLRARGVAGGLAVGRDFLAELSPFVYRRRVDPAIAVELMRLLLRSREELGDAAGRDLKLGPGGIREAEFFVQALQLIWGGQEPSVRAQGTLDAIRKLHMRSLVSDRESREMSSAYLLLRRLEHRVQWMTGVQTHALPESGPELLRLARTLGHESEQEMLDELAVARRAVERRFASLVPDVRTSSPYADLFARIAEDDHGQVTAICERLGVATHGDIAKDLFALARRPDDPLGSATAERFPDFGPAFLEAILDAADPELCARTLRATFSRVVAPVVYVTPMAEDPRALRRLIAVLGSSAFVGASVQNHPELRDRVLFAGRPPTPDLAAEEILADPRLVTTEDSDPEEQVGALRRAKLRLTLDVALADLTGDLQLFDAMRVLSSIADATLEATCALAAGTFPAPPRGLAIVALGKLGGRELGYGSDLDVVFLYDPEAAPEGRDPAEYFARLAQRIVRWVTSPHAGGPGYELDTRLRPSGAQGMLVTSLSSFARYHRASSGDPNGPVSGGGAAAWERQALLRARFAAGDRMLGERAIEIADRAAYEGGAPDPHELHRLRIRMEAELGKERPGRYNSKTGHGGLTDVEFAVQFLQMRHGHDRSVRSPETRAALDALEAAGHIDRENASILREGHQFLRRLEQRIHIVHASSAQLLDETAEGLGHLARRMGLRDSPDMSAGEALVQRYLEITDRVRIAYAAVIGVDVLPRATRSNALTPIPGATEPA